MNATASLRRPYTVIEEPASAPSVGRPTAFAFEDVTKSFGATRVLTGIDLCVAQGEFVAV